MPNKRKRYMIVADNGVLWSSDRYDGYEEGCSIINAVAEGNLKGYVEQIGEAWQGSVILVKELARPSGFACQP